jgi:branched-chain amino acid transport system ATP-binding protein
MKELGNHRLDEQPLLEVQGLCKRFEGLLALNQVNFSVRQNEIKSMIGPNGAGKTTLFNVISGALPPSVGKIFFRNQDITRLHEYARARMGIVRSFQITSIFPELSVFENLRLAAQAKWNNYNFWSKATSIKTATETAENILEYIELADVRNRLAAELSHGEQRHLDMGIAIATNPQLLLLDEPTAGMAAKETEATMNLIQKLGEKYSIILVEHDMDVVMHISDIISVLHKGEIIAEGSPDQIRTNETVISVYLGKDIEQ